MTKNTDIGNLFARDYPFAFKLLIVLVLFGAFRPDRLLPDGRVLLYLPTVILLFLVVLWLTAPGKVFNNPQTKLLFAFVLLMIVQIPFARNSRWAFYAIRSFFLYTVLAYFVTVRFLDTAFKVDRYVRLYVVASLFLGLLGILGKGIVNIPVLHDENDFCLMMNFLLPFGFFLAQEAKTKAKKIFYYCLMGVFIAGSLVSFSRGGFLGLAATGLFVILKSKKKVSAIALLLIAGVIIFYFAPQGYWDEMKTIQTEGAETGTGKERVESWKAGWRMFLDHPIIGVGAINYGIWLPDYYVQYSSKTPERMWGRAAHSLYFTLLPEMGIVGILIFFGVLWKNYKDHRYIIELNQRMDGLIDKSILSKEESKQVKEGIQKLYFFSLAYFGAMIAYLATGIFISVLWYGYFWMLTSFWVATANVARKIENVLLEGGVSSSGNG